MFHKVIFSPLVAALLLAAEAGAVPAEMDKQVVAAGHVSARAGVLLRQGSPAPEPALGVLHIPVDGQTALEGPVRTGGSQRLNDKGIDASDSLGSARVPLPAAAWLFGTAVVGIIAVSRRRPGRQFG